MKRIRTSEKILSLRFKHIVSLRCWSRKTKKFLSPLQVLHQIPKNNGIRFAEGMKRETSFRAVMQELLKSKMLRESLVL